MPQENKNILTNSDIPEPHSWKATLGQFLILSIVEPDNSIVKDDNIEILKELERAERHNRQT